MVFFYYYFIIFFLSFFYYYYYYTIIIIIYFLLIRDIINPCYYGTILIPLSIFGWPAVVCSGSLRYLIIDISYIIGIEFFRASEENSNIKWYSPKNV